MATPKKPAAKKAPVKKPVAKKTVATKAPVKKAAAKKAPAKSAMRSFRVSSSEVPFTTFKITRQTVYWVILIAFIIFVQLWILKLQIEIATLLEMQQNDIMNNL